jgi:hypothetical protein
MPDKEHDLLVDELIDISGRAVEFINSHVVGDGFYKKAYDHWVSHYTPRAKKILAQLYYHSYVAMYTVRELSISWRWAQSWAETCIKRMNDRIGQQFRKIHLPYVPHETDKMWWINTSESVHRVCEMWGVRADWLTTKLDGYSIRTASACHPEVISTHGFTERHFKNLLAGDRNSLDGGHISEGERAHYMHMKLEGAVFQFELVPPVVTRNTSSRSSEPKQRRLSESKIGHIAKKWQRLS